MLNGREDIPFYCEARRDDNRDMLARLRTGTAVAPSRNVAIDAYRGLVMLLMMAEVLRLSQV